MHLLMTLRYSLRGSPYLYVYSILETERIFSIQNKYLKAKYTKESVGDQVLRCALQIRWIAILESESGAEELASNVKWRLTPVPFR